MKCIVASLSRALHVLILHVLQMTPEANTCMCVHIQVRVITEVSNDEVINAAKKIGKSFTFTCLKKDIHVDVHDMYRTF